MARKSPHTSTNPGKRVRLVLRDGTHVEGRFKERTGQFVVLDEGRFRGRDIDKFIVVKGPSPAEDPSLSESQTQAPRGPGPRR